MATKKDESKTTVTKMVKARPKKIKIFLPKDKNLNQDDVIVVINGKTTIIQRGVEVEVSPAVYKVLRSSEIEQAHVLKVIESFTDKDKKK